MPTEYSAFISYRHRSPDLEIAKALHGMIENYTVPRGLRGATGAKHPGKVFRDQDELPLSANLGEDLKTALKQSEWLICVCSPDYPKSLWCMREIEYFLEYHDRNHILTILVAGEPSESFPEILRHMRDEKGNEVPIEPLAADVRGENLQESLKKLRSEKLRLLAPMLGTTYDGLYQRRKRRAIRNGLIISVSVSLLLTAFLIYTLIQNDRINTQRIAAARNQTDLLVEKANTYTNMHRKTEARELAAQARTVSGTIDDYAGERIHDALAFTCYSGDFSVEAALSFDQFTPTAATEVFSPDGKKAVGPVSASTLACCDTVTGQRLWTRRYDNTIGSVRWKKNSSVIAVTVPASHRVELLDAETGEPMGILSVSWVRNAMFTGEKVCLSFEQGMLLWDPEEDPAGERMMWILKDPSGQELYSQVFHEERFAVTVNCFGPEPVAGIVDTVQEETMLLKLPGNQVISGFTPSPDGKLVFIHQWDHALVYDPAREQILWQDDRDTPVRMPGIGNDPAPLWNGDRIYDNMTDMEEIRCQVYDAGTGTRLFELKDDLVLAVSEDGKRLIGRNGLYRAEDGSLIVSFPGTLLAVDPGEQHYLMREDAFYLETAVGKGTQFTVPEAPMLYSDKNETYMASTRDGHYSVLVIPEQEKLMFVDTTQENAPHTIHDFRFGAQPSSARMTFSAGQQMVAIAGERGNLSVFDLETGEEMHSWDNFYPKTSIRDMTFSRDDSFLMAADWQGTTYAVYSITGGNLLYTMHAEEKVADWGFDAETGDAVICYENGTALVADLFTEPEELYAFVEKQK